MEVEEKGKRMIREEVEWSGEFTNVRPPTAQRDRRHMLSRDTSYRLFRKLHPFFYLVSPFFPPLFTPSPFRFLPLHPPIEGLQCVSECVSFPSPIAKRSSFEYRPRPSTEATARLGVTYGVK